ncbi:MAG TPA: TonB family protein [Polyangiaceae bacterium]|nr:TonB family protein [Polyangiaceae bacterium]
MGRWLAFWLALVGALLAASSAYAQQPAAPVVVAPALKSDSPATYPEQALKDGVRETATVTLLLTIDATGHVQDAKPETPAGHGFDEAAVLAAQGLVFAPATKDGKPFASRVKYVYRFAPPPGRVLARVLTKNDKPIAGARVVLKDPAGAERMTTSGDDGSVRFDALPFGRWQISIQAEGFVDQSAEQDIAPGEEASNVFRLERVPVAPPPTADAGAAQEPETEEVVVRGQKPAREVTKRTIEQSELLRIPGSNGDALRSLQNLPGVARPPGLAGLLIVRGSAPQDTQIFVDGTNIPLVYHFGGLSSVVPTELLDRIDFYPGNFSAQYGRAMGGIVDVGIRDPSPPCKKGEPRTGSLTESSGACGIHGLAQADLIDVRLVVEGPIADGWSFALGARRSWVDTWLKPVLEATGAGVTTAPVYYDWQAMVQKDWSKKQQFRLLFFGSDDRLDLLIKDPNASAPSLSGDLSFHTAFWRLQARYRNKLSEDTELKLTAAFGEDKIDFALGNLYFTLDSYPLSGRAEISQKLFRGAVANVGLDMMWTQYSLAAQLPAPGVPGQPSGGPFGSKPPVNETQTGQNYMPAAYAELELTPWKGARIVPGVRLDYTKVTGRWDLAPRVVVRQDVGPAFPRTTLKGGVGVFYEAPFPQQSDPVFGQVGLVSERAVQYDLGIEREFTKYLEASFEGFYKQLDDLVISQNGNSGEGWVYGLETLIRYKPDKHFFGWIAYTLSQSLRKDTPTSPVRTAPFDQTHILTILGSYKLGRGWEVGARFRLVSGNPYTPNAYGFYDANSGVYLPLSSFPPNNARMPLFHQLDIRVDKTWKFQYWRFGVYADVQNVYNAGNVEGISYNFNYAQQSYATGLPFLPSIGLRGEL